MSTPYPFTAIVGMADLRLALLVNALSPSIGGVLVQVATVADHVRLRREERLVGVEDRHEERGQPQRECEREEYPAAVAGRTKPAHRLRQSRVIAFFGRHLIVDLTSTKAHS